MINLQLFADGDAPAGTIITTDVEPAISIDMTSKLSKNINELRRILGINAIDYMPTGGMVKVYEAKIKGAIPAQVGEGETIPLTEVERKLAKTIEIVPKKYRKNTTLEAIQKAGQRIAVNTTDSKLIEAAQKDIKNSFYSMIALGTGTATGTDLQTTLAQTWSALQVRYEDYDVAPVYFISPQDAADYLGSASITLQTAFGMTYIENFLGLGTAFIVPSLAQGVVYGTAKENLHLACAGSNSDVASTFGLTYDESGLVGMRHAIKEENATIETLIVSGAIFYPEYADGIVKGTISGS